jgi:hypothetical protein
MSDTDYCPKYGISCLHKQHKTKINPQSAVTERDIIQPNLDINSIYNNVICYVAVACAGRPAAPADGT